MKYVISDIHGCYDEFIELLRKIELSEKDDLYILGDCVDRGPDPMKVLLDLEARKNVTYITGNHDFLFLYFMKITGLALNGETADDCTDEDISDFKLWMKDGGSTSVQSYIKLNDLEKQRVIEFLEHGKDYGIIRQDQKEYILVQADFDPTKELDQYELQNFIEERIDYSRRYFPNENTFIITGHTPTPLIRKEHLPEVYIGNRHIAIDCGCVFGGRMAAFCLDTGKLFMIRENCKI